MSRELLARLHKSESEFMGQLNMLVSLFLEPVAPLPVDLSRVLARVEPLCDVHAQLWRRLEPLLDAQHSNADHSDHLLANYCLLLYRFAPALCVYIPFIKAHEQIMSELKQLLASNRKFAALARDAAALRPGSSLPSLLLLLRCRPWQMKRSLLHAAALLTDANDPAHRAGIFAARAAARTLLQIQEIARLECADQETQWLQELSKSFERPASPIAPATTSSSSSSLSSSAASFFPHDCSILWKGIVRVGMDNDCRLVICYDRMLLLRRPNAFFSVLPLEPVGRWIRGSQGRVSASVFSALEVGAAADAPRLFGVHLVAHAGLAGPSLETQVDWRVIVADRMATTVLVSAVKEMMTVPDMAAGHIYQIDLATDDVLDVWVSSRDGGPPPDRGEFVGKSPDEVAAVLRDMKLNYEKESAIVLESGTFRLVRQLGTDAVAAVLIPLAPALAVALGDSEALRASVDICADAEFEDWRPVWEPLFAKHLADAEPDTLFRGNQPLLLFTTLMLANQGSDWLLGVAARALEEAEEDMNHHHQHQHQHANGGVVGPDDERISLVLLEALSRADPPRTVAEILVAVRGLIEARPHLVPYCGRGLLALFVLRFAGPTLVQLRGRSLAKAVKRVVAAVNGSGSPDEERFASALQTRLLGLSSPERGLVDSFISADTDNVRSLVSLLDRVDDKVLQTLEGLSVPVEDIRQLLKQKE